MFFDVYILRIIINLQAGVFFTANFVPATNRKRFHEFEAIIDLDNANTEFRRQQSLHGK
jgi:hypothetical protein